MQIYFDFLTKKKKKAIAGDLLSGWQKPEHFVAIWLVILRPGPDILLPLEQKGIPRPLSLCFSLVVAGI